MKRLRVAFDLGSGATKMAVALVTLPEPAQSGTTPKPAMVTEINQLIYAEESEVLLGESMCRSSVGVIDEPTKAILLEVMAKYDAVVEKVRQQFGMNMVVERCGVATAVYRKAKNGPALLAEMKTRFKIPAMVISQEMEGVLGFNTAIGAASVASNWNVSEIGAPHPLPQLSQTITTDESKPGAIPAVVWDSGGASFQLTLGDCTTGGITSVFQGEWGSSSATHAMLTTIQKREVSATSGRVTPNPVSLSDFEHLVNHLKEQIQGRTPLPSWADWSFNESAGGRLPLIAIGGPTCAFRMCCLAVGRRHHVDVNSICEAAHLLFGRTDAEMVYSVPADSVLADTRRNPQAETHPHDATHLKQPSSVSGDAPKVPFHQPEMLLSKMALVAAVLELTRAPFFCYFPTVGCTLGLLRTPAIWDTIVAQSSAEQRHDSHF